MLLLFTREEKEEGGMNKRVLGGYFLLFVLLDFQSYLGCNGTFILVMGITKLSSQSNSLLKWCLSYQLAPSTRSNRG